MPGAFPGGLHAGTFIRADASVVVAELVRWKEEIGRRLTIVERSALGVRFAISYVAGRAPFDYQDAVVQCRAGWSFFTNNDIREAMPQSEGYVLCKRLKCDTFALKCDDDCMYPGRRFEVQRFDASQEFLTQERYVCAMKGYASWEFHQEGEPLPFERLQRYQERRIKDRVDLELLKEYAAAMGIRFWDPDFYQSEAYGLRQATPEEAESMGAPAAKPVSVVEVFAETMRQSGIAGVIRVLRSGVMSEKE